MGKEVAHPLVAVLRTVAEEDMDSWRWSMSLGGRQGGGGGRQVGRGGRQRGHGGRRGDSFSATKAKNRSTIPGFSGKIITFD